MNSPNARRRNKLKLLPTGIPVGEDRIKRRRFLADLLFIGGALTAAALLAREMGDQLAEPPNDPRPVGTPAMPVTPVPLVTPPSTKAKAATES